MLAFRQGKWQVSRTQVGNVHTGIRQNNTADLNALERKWEFYEV